LRCLKPHKNNSRSVTVAAYLLNEESYCRVDKTAGLVRARPLSCSFMQLMSQQFHELNP
jgi:hypothetical protein